MNEVSPWGVALGKCPKSRRGLKDFGVCRTNVLLVRADRYDKSCLELRKSAYRSRASKRSARYDGVQRRLPPNLIGGAIHGRDELRLEPDLRLHH